MKTLKIITLLLIVNLLISACGDGGSNNTSLDPIINNYSAVPIYNYSAAKITILDCEPSIFNVISSANRPKERTLCYMEYEEGTHSIDRAIISEPIQNIYTSFVINSGESFNLVFNEQLLSELGYETWTKSPLGIYDYSIWLESDSSILPQSETSIISVKAEPLWPILDSYTSNIKSSSMILTSYSVSIDATFDNGSSVFANGSTINVYYTIDYNSNDYIHEIYFFDHCTKEYLFTKTTGAEIPSPFTGAIPYNTANLRSRIIEENMLGECYDSGNYKIYLDVGVLSTERVSWSNVLNNKYFILRRFNN